MKDEMGKACGTRATASKKAKQWAPGAGVEPATRDFAAGKSPRQQRLTHALPTTLRYFLRSAAELPRRCDIGAVTGNRTRMSWTTTTRTAVVL